MFLTIDILFQVFVKLSKEKAELQIKIYYLNEKCGCQEVLNVCTPNHKRSLT